MKPLFYTFLIIFGVIIIVGLGSVLLVLWAYGAGQVLLKVLPESLFSPFEATLLNLVGVLIVGLLVVRFISSATTETLTPQRKNVPKKAVAKAEEEKTKETTLDVDANEDATPGIPLWRQPLKTVDFSNAKPNDPCPCGSGRRYRQCHGYKQAVE